jgi:LmbE family N-acetylglucosaminyl deacetylase
MIHVKFEAKDRSDLRILCLGSHSDDIEIGCGGTILRLAEQYAGAEFYWVVFSAIGVRESEARCAAKLFAATRVKSLILKHFQDGFMPYLGVDIKSFFEQDLKLISPDLIFTHNGKDAHQDHRLISELTWNTFRDHLILEYEIPKYDGDLGCPNVFVPLPAETCQRKVRYIVNTFESQHAKHWFQEDVFFSLMRLRGMECSSPSGHAEAFYCRKLIM